jgi:hypothetical protein
MASQEDNSFIVISDTANSGNYTAANANNFRTERQQFGSQTFTTENSSINRSFNMEQSSYQSSSIRSSGQQQQPQQQLFQRPVFGIGRSGSLPPLVSRISQRSPARAEHMEIEDENYSTHHSYAVAGAAESQSAYYKGIEQKVRSQFKPIEFVIDTPPPPTHAEIGKRPRSRDQSNPTTIESKRVRTPVSFLDSNDEDYLAGELNEIENKYRIASLPVEETTGRISSNFFLSKTFSCILCNFLKSIK